MNHLPLLVLGTLIVAKEGLCEKGSFEQILEINLGIKSKFKFELYLFHLNFSDRTQTCEGNSDTMQGKICNF